MSTEQIKDLAYFQKNAEENYMTTPISVLRYIVELEVALEEQRESAYRKGYDEGYEFGVTEMEGDL